MFPPPVFPYLFVARGTVHNELVDFSSHVSGRVRRDST